MCKIEKKHTLNYNTILKKIMQAAAACADNRFVICSKVNGHVHGNHCSLHQQCVKDIIGILPFFFFFPSSSSCLLYGCPL